MANDKIQKSAYGSTRAIIKAADIEDREPIWNPDLKEMLVNYSSGIGWFEFPSEERLYTGIDDIAFARNLVGDQTSGAHFIGVQDGFTNILGNRPLHNTLISIDDELGNRINKDGSVNVEESQIFEKGVVINDEDGTRKIGTDALASLGDTGVTYAYGKELLFNRDFEMENHDFAWSGLASNLELITTTGTVLKYTGNGSGNAADLTQKVALSAGIYEFGYDVIENTDYGVGDIGIAVMLTDLTDLSTGVNKQQIITIADDATEFTLAFTDDSAAGYISLDNLTLRKASAEMLRDGGFDIDPSSNWRLNSSGELTFVGTLCRFIPVGLTDVTFGDDHQNSTLHQTCYADDGISGAFELDTWYEFTYDIAENTDINSYISLYLQLAPEMASAVLIDSTVGTDKKVVFKSPEFWHLDSVGNIDNTRFQIMFICNNATPGGAYIDVTNLSMKKMQNGNLTVGKNVKIGGDIDVLGSLSQANITGYLNLKSAKISFYNSATVSMPNYYQTTVDLVNATIIDVSNKEFTGLTEVEYVIQLPDIDDVGDGRTYIFINRTDKLNPAHSQPKLWLESAVSDYIAEIDNTVYELEGYWGITMVVSNVTNTIYEDSASTANNWSVFTGWTLGRGQD